MCKRREKIENIILQYNKIRIIFVIVLWEKESHKEYKVIKLVTKNTIAYKTIIQHYILWYIDLSPKKRQHKNRKQYRMDFKDISNDNII